MCCLRCPMVETARHHMHESHHVVALAGALSLSESLRIPPSETSLASQSMSSISESDSSMMSSAGEDLILASPLDFGTQPASSGTGSVALSDVLAVKRAGWQSRGSSSHTSCSCKPCAFENRRQFFSTKPCVKGALCEFCHEPHANELRKQKRQASRARAREAWTNESVVGKPTDDIGN